jgi:hypothetical protein
MTTTTQTITRSRGGTQERTVDINDITIPDLWNYAQRQEEPIRSELLELWHLCHDLKRSIIDNA